MIRAEDEELSDRQLSDLQVEELWGLDTTVAETLLSACGAVHGDGVGRDLIQARGPRIARHTSQTVGELRTRE